MKAPNQDLLRAVELALANDWEAAHNLVQRYEGDITAAWIHAVLHKLEVTSQLEAVALLHEYRRLADDG